MCQHCVSKPSARAAVPSWARSGYTSMLDNLEYKQGFYCTALG